MLILETERLLLRTWQQEDLKVLFAISSDPCVMEHFPSIQTLKETEQFFNKIQTHYETLGYTLYAVELKATGEMIGFVGLLTVGFEAAFTPAVEIGWRLAKAHWGNGYAPEAAKAVLHLAFTKFNLDKIVSFTALSNVNSQRVMEKIGLEHNLSDDFEHPALPKEHRLSKHVLYQLTRARYLAKQASL